MRRDSKIEKKLLGNEAVHLSGNSASFLVLADFIRKSDKGAIAAILPLVTATNASALEIRCFLGKNYHVETIISSHDPERIYFSENTDIGEMLLICRKWDSGKRRKPPTQVINLSKNPATPADAISVGWSIQDGTLQNQDIGTVQHMSATQVEAGNWGAVQFLSEHLVSEFSAR